MHCLLIEDRLELVPELVSMLELQKGIESVHTAMHPYQIRYLLKTIPISLVLCSPQLWSYGYFKDMRSVPGLIFTSWNKAKIREDQKGPVLNVIREPWNKLQLQNVLAGVKRMNVASATEFLFIRFERRWRPVYFKDIELIEKKSGSYVLICCSSDNYLVAGSLNSWLQRLPEGRFLRPCDNLIVPFADASKFTGDVYLFRGRTIRLTFKFANRARKEMELP